MKIAFFLPHMTMGGVERSTSILANQLHSMGHEVWIVGLGKSDRPPDAYAGLKYHHINAGKVSVGLPKLIRFLRREKPDAIISSQSYANVTVVLACKLACFKGRVIITERLNVSASTEGTDSFKDSVTTFLMRRFYRSADGIVAISEGVASDLSTLTGMPRDRFTVIYNPVNSPDIYEKAKEPVDEPWLNNPSLRVLVTVARLERQKNLGSLIEAFSTLDADDLRLLIIGDGSERKQLEQFAQELHVADRVRFAGAQANPYRFMARSHLFVLSSLFEGLGNVLVEALALKLPVVSTDCPSGPSEILGNGDYGLLVPSADSEALATGLRNALGDYESMKRKTEAAQASLSRFTPETAAGAYLKLLQAD